MDSPHHWRSWRGCGEGKGCRPPATAASAPTAATRQDRITHGDLIDKTGNRGEILHFTNGLKEEVKISVAWIFHVFGTYQYPAYIKVKEIYKCTNIWDYSLCVSNWGGMSKFISGT